MLIRNVAGQIVYIFAFDGTTNAGKTGDAAQITGAISRDGAGSSPITDTNPSECGGGWYAFTLTAAETNAEKLAWYGASSTGGVLVQGNQESTFPTRLAHSANTITFGVVGSGSTETSVVFASVDPTIGLDSLKGKVLSFESDSSTAALVNQSATISSNTAGATPTISLVTALTTSPIAGDKVVVT